MTQPTGLRRPYYAYLSRMYAFAYTAAGRSVLGFRISTWLILIPFGLLVYGWWQQWPAAVLLLLLVLITWLVGSFWAARRANYVRFIPNDKQLMATETLAPLGPEEKVALFATGVFGVSSRQSSVLLRPATYWLVPLGEHVIMVEEQPGRFLYQFFGATTLQSISEGWLLFGSEPRPALAVTFLANWGPAFTKFALYDDGKEDSEPSNLQTIYLTFDGDAGRQAMWHTIVSDARRAREAAAGTNSL